MTDQAVVRPFGRDDLLAYDELDPECRALRALMAVMADTGATVLFPVDLVPSYKAVAIASGWTLRPDFNPVPDAKPPHPDRGLVAMRCERQPLALDPRPRQGGAG